MFCTVTACDQPSTTVVAVPLIELEVELCDGHSRQLLGQLDRKLDVQVRAA